MFALFLKIRLMKNKFVKVLVYMLLTVILLIGGLLTYVKTMLPNVGDAPNIKIEASPAQIERGKYLANHVTVCMDCHSTRDWSTFAGPMVAGTEGKGGEVFDEKLGFPGRFVAPNLTPSNLKNWTDGEIFRAITCGVNKDGKALFPIMPHPNFGKMDEKDIHAIIAYIRSLKPIENKTAASVANFPMNLILNTIPKPAVLTQIPNKSDQVAYGKYLVNAASCNDCHTKQDKGKFVGEPFAGGFEFKFPDGSIVTSVNITPDPTGIGSWDKATFVSRFKMYADSGYVPQKVKDGEFKTVMPWTMYAGMSTQDLEAMYAYLKTLKPANNIVERFKTAGI
jgi:mono/diheme cytochrome c family protein